MGWVDVSELLPVFLLDASRLHCPWESLDASPVHDQLTERKGTHIESDTVGLNIKNIVNESDTVTFLYAEDNPFPGESLVWAFAEYGKFVSNTLDAVKVIQALSFFCISLVVEFITFQYAVDPENPLETDIVREKEIPGVLDVP